MHYIVMEYVEGITLKTYIEKKGRLLFKEAVSIAIQVGRGIEAAHNKGIIHRDIKPQNIMISTEGKVKVTDFGIARAASSNTINSDVMGSVHYASPEQARNGFVDGKSDIYSLGIVMYEMVTGRVPFDGESTVAVAIQHLQEEMVVPSAYAPDLPISMEKIILKCTQKSADRRYDSISDLLIDLKKSLVSPDEDFVVMVPLGQQAKTRIMSPKEVKEIKERTGPIYSDSEDEETEYYEDDEDDDEDEEGFLNPKMEKAVTVLGIVAALIIVGIIIYIAVNLVSGLKFGKTNKEKEEENVIQEEQNTDKIEMIDLKGMTFDEAKTELNKIGLGIKRGGTQSSDQYKEGQIVDQSEEKGNMVEANTTIEVILSSGAGEIDVPDVLGHGKSSAENKITAAGFTVGYDYAYSNDVPADDVISQNPAGGSKAKKGDKITIVLSRGPEMVKVPSVLGKTEEEAKAELAAANLDSSNVKSDYSDTYPEGQVCAQSEAAGQMVYPGTSVTITVSLGPKIKIYSLNTQIERLKDIPETAENVKAKITLYKSEGNDQINTWTATSFPYAISQGNIENCGIGYFIIDWEWTMLNEEGEEILHTKQTTQEGIVFNQN